MKIISTPPQRHRPRLDFDGPVRAAVRYTFRKATLISLRGFGDRHWTLEFTPDEWRDIVTSVERGLERSC